MLDIIAKSRQKIQNDTQMDTQMGKNDTQDERNDTQEAKNDTKKNKE